MKIGLINPLSLYVPSPSEREFVYLNGINYISASLKEDHDITIADFEHNSKASLETLADCDVIGLTSNITCYKFFKENLPRIKIQNPSSPIVVGGALVSSYGLENNVLMKTFSEIDYAVIGEGEITTLNLLKNLENSSTQIPRGVLYRNTQGKLINTGKGEKVKNLDNLPDRDYDSWGDFKREIEDRILMVNLARGCPNSCSFCYNMSPGVRSFSPDKMQREIQRAWNLKPSQIEFMDETLTYDKERTLQLTRIARELGINYSAETRVDCVDENILRELKNSGCQTIRFGIESFDEGILNRANKRITLKQTYTAIEKANKVGLNVFGFFVLGLPGENKKSLEKTIRGIKETGVIPRVRILMPFPGTRIYQQALRENKFDEVELLKQFSQHRDTIDGDWVYMNISDVSDRELIEARNRINEIGNQKGK